MAKRTTKRATTGRHTIFSIAQAAGVSIATVSRALKNDPVVNPQTGDRIRKIADELGYRPSPIASCLASGRTGMIAMLIPTARNPLYATLAEKVTHLARQRDYELLVTYVEADAPQEREILKHLANAQVDGYIIVTQFWLENRQAILELTQPPRRQPVIVRNHVEPDCPIDSVSIDFKSGTLEAARHLISLGHRDIRYLGFPSRISTADRPAGFRQAMEEAGLPISDKTLIYCGEGINDAYEAALGMFQKDPPTAMIIQSDYFAFGVLRAAAEANLRIPEDLSLIAFDGIELASYSTYPLTTMVQPLTDIAETMLDSIFHRLENDSSEPIRKNFKLTLREGRTVGPPRPSSKP